MGHMKYEHTKPYEDWFWEKNRIQLKNAYISGFDFRKKTLTSSAGESIGYDKLIICSGSKPNVFDWKGKDLQGVQGLYSKQDLELMEQNTKEITEAVIVGGGLIGIEMAEMLNSRNIKVHFLIRETTYWNSVLPKEEGKLVGRHIAEHHINLLPETELDEISGDDQGRVKGIRTKSGETINCQFLGLTVGVKPSIDFLRETELKLDKGILINEYLETNIPDVYACGDCAQFSSPKQYHPPVEQLWYTGRMQAKALANTICGNKTAYDRGIWFNSAKFLDIEYQTYGLMFNTPLAGEDTFYWEHPVGKICLRINFSKTDGAVKGFNFFGIRFRQVIADGWIRQGQTVSDCVSALDQGFFDAEFSKNHHKAILGSFNEQFPLLKATLKKKKFLIF